MNKSNAVKLLSLVSLMGMSASRAGELQRIVLDTNLYPFGEYSTKSDVETKDSVSRGVMLIPQYSSENQQEAAARIPVSYTVNVFTVPGVERIKKWVSNEQYNARLTWIADKSIQATAISAGLALAALGSACFSPSVLDSENAYKIFTASLISTPVFYVAAIAAACARGRETAPTLWKPSASMCAEMGFDPKSAVTYDSVGSFSAADKIFNMIQHSRAHPAQQGHVAYIAKSENPYLRPTYKMSAKEYLAQNPS